MLSGKYALRMFDLVDKEILLVCGAGGMAALTGRTMLEMGYRSVTNIGGFSAWKDAGGPVES